MVGMKADLLPGWSFLPIAVASLVTGVGAAWAAFIFMIMVSPVLSLSAFSSGEFASALANLAVLGLAVGAFAICPLAMILSAVGLRLAITRPSMARRSAWASVGATSGAILLLLPILISAIGGNSDVRPSELWTVLFGACCGAFAATLCHRLLHVGQTP